MRDGRKGRSGDTYRLDERQIPDEQRPGGGEMGEEIRVIPREPVCGLGVGLDVGGQ